MKLRKKLFFLQYEIAQGHNMLQGKKKTTSMKTKYFLQQTHFLQYKLKLCQLGVESITYQLHKNLRVIWDYLIGILKKFQQQMPMGKEVKLSTSGS